MYATSLLHKILNHSCCDIHAARLNACYLAVQSLVEGAKATVTSLGRGLSGTAYDKHKIKRIYRLPDKEIKASLGKIKMHAEAVLCC